MSETDLYLACLCRARALIFYFIPIFALFFRLFRFGGVMWWDDTLGIGIHSYGFTTASEEASATWKCVYYLSVHCFILLRNSFAFRSICTIYCLASRHKNLFFRLFLHLLHFICYLSLPNCPSTVNKNQQSLSETSQHRKIKPNNRSNVKDLSGLSVWFVCCMRQYSMVFIWMFS